MMNRQVRQNGFSLTEAMIATGILAMGLVMIAMAFPVGVKLASIATERPVGVVAGNEAFCKMKLYGLAAFTEPNWVTPVDTTCRDYWRVSATWLSSQEQDDQRCYPSLVPQPEERRYYWSALVRRAGAGAVDVQATVFVCRMLGMGSKYYDMDAANNQDNPWPVPVKVRVEISTVAPLSQREITILPSTPVYTPSGTEYRFFTEGCFIVEDSTGVIYRVLETQDKDEDADGTLETLVLDKNFASPAALPYVWVVPPAVGSNRNPCIDVTQTVLTIP